MAAADNQQDLLGADNSNQNLLATGGSANDTTTTVALGQGFGNPAPPTRGPPGGPAAGQGGASGGASGGDQSNL
eukprot:CAMPEP_0201740262 /NCGR_PEP_ID=MMETSP0593-20130828/46211_1 /ASSEMBLY_ACC=CAM_ASM_000672 /TAXON_ID=267983 /ORGANISM="Skeletonema japonicum, Strain CCMP2506" /LENGTH=73 /DNA_ID=CAMNT_0048234567 /DNA_START=881 /DNA_END=1102 /DNA_ORIENTATION=-